MPLIRPLTLTGKIVALVALLGALAVTITVYSLAHLHAVDRDYRALLDHEAQAAVLVTAAAQDVSDASRLVFAVLTEQEEQKMRAALQVLDVQQHSFQTKLATIRPLLPTAAGQLDTIHTQEEELFKLADAIVDAAARWRGDRALEIIHTQFDPLLLALRHNLEQVRSNAVTRFQGASQELSATTAHTLRNTALAFGVALVSIIGLAVWFSLTRIARPIRDLTHSMELLAQRDYHQAIGHTARRDEVGQMAQTLEVFRSALQHSDYLEQAKLEAEQLAQAKSSFLATMSHEIRTPLNAIIGLAQLSLRRTLPAEQKGRIEKIQRAGQHLLGIVNNILDFSKIEGGFLQSESIPFAPQQLLEDVRMLLAGKAAAKSLILLADAPQSLPVLLGDPLRIRQILFNFASNAIKFSEHGTVRLHLALEQQQEACFLLGEVSDQGIGLTSAQCAQLFQPFQQADASISRRYGGTGLGLAISRSLADLLGGSVGVRSQPDIGSTFWLRVTVRVAPPGVEPMATAAPHTASPAVLHGLRALLVDDNDLNRLVGQELLADADIHCDEATNGEQAIQLLEQAPDGYYDVVLMDMMMPGLDGCAATRLLRQNPRFATLPIIAMTANTSPQDMQTCLAAGMQALIPKPIDEHILWNTLLAHCDLGRRAYAQPVPAVHHDALPAFSTQPHTPEGFDINAAVERLGHDMGLYTQLAQMFVTQSHDTATRVQQAWVSGDNKTTDLLLHTLQGQAATLGAVALQQAARQTQTDLHTATPPAQAQALLLGLAQALDNAVTHLQNLLTHWAPAASESLPVPAAHAARLLIVDDQVSSALALQHIFAADYAITVVHSGEEALAACNGTAPLPDVILLDIEMPDMSGLQVCRRLKFNPLTTNIPVLFVTGQSTPQEESAALAAGAVDFISKPINHAVVRARVHTHLQLKARNDQLRAQSLLDGLTGIANRRRFDQALAQEWRAGERQRQPLALCLVDIDHFKHFNDHYGHPAGDECLKTIAQALQQQLGRAHDLVARYGGEEFACLLTDIHPTNALRKAQTLCDSIAALQLPHAASSIAPYVTISVGVAVWAFDQPGNEQQLLAAADAALYAAKHAGRNQARLGGAQESGGNVPTN